MVVEAEGWLVDGRYRVERLLGRGGVGAVYAATRLSDGEPVAIKLVYAEHAADEAIVTRFAREAKAASAVASEHIARVLDSGSHAGRPFLVMELLAGEDLGQRLRRDHRLSTADTVHVLTETLRALASAHAAGIVHRDLKPDNVFLVPRPAGPALVKIVDFGTSKLRPLDGKTAPLSVTRNGVAVGTPLYMSPEQAEARADVDERSDLYSVGAIAFECLTGRPPHVGETDDDVVAAICSRDAPPVRSLAPATAEPLAAFVDRALARDRARRFPTARDMLGALAAAARGDATASPRASRPSVPDTRLPDRRTPARSSRPSVPVSGWTWVLAAGAALLGVVGTAWVGSRYRQARSDVAASVTATAAVDAGRATGGGAVDGETSRGAGAGK